MLGFFVITLDAVIVNVALSTIQADLGDGVTGLQWVVDGYTLAATHRRLADRSDRRAARSAPS